MNWIIYFRKRQALCSYVIVSLFLCLLFAPHKTEARLTVFDPEAMLEGADIIATGTVVSLEPGDEEELNQGTIALDTLLKGEVADGDVVLTEQRYIGDKMWLQRIPPVGTMVFLLLKHDDGQQSPGYIADGNHIGLLVDDHVTEVYQGINTSIKPYAETYDAYYQRHKDQARKINRQSEWTPTKLNMDGSQMAFPEASLSGFTNTTNTPNDSSKLFLIAVCIAAMLVLAMFAIWWVRRNRQRRT